MQKAISHCRPILSDEIPHIEQSITTYMDIFRTTFQDITPIHSGDAIHGLNSITLELDCWGNSEQDGELIHTSVAQLHRNPEARIKLIMQTQQLRYSPELLYRVAPVKTRKKRDFV